MSPSRVRENPRPRFKTCSCGRTFSRESWNRIPVSGFMDKGKDLAGVVIELKNCECGSTLAVDLGDEPDSIATIKVTTEPRGSR